MHGTLIVSWRYKVMILHTINTQDNESMGEERQWTILAYHMSNLSRYAPTVVARVVLFWVVAIL